MEIVSEPDIRSRRGGGRLHAQAALDPALPRHLRRQHGGGQPALRRQRLGAPPGRPARHALRGQEPELDALRRPRDRARGAPPGRAARGGRHGRAGDPPVRCGARARRARCAPRRRRTTTATSPTPTCCRSSSTRRSSRRSSGRCPSCRTPRRRASCARTVSPPTTPRCWSRRRRRPTISRRRSAPDRGRGSGAAAGRRGPAARDPKLVANWLLTELFGALNRAGRDLAHSPITPDRLGRLVDLIQDGTISGPDRQGRVFRHVRDRRGPGGDRRAEGPEADLGCERARADRRPRSSPPTPIRSTSCGATPRSFGWFVGQVMKATQGQANPQLVNEVLRKKLGAEPAAAVLTSSPRGMKFLPCVNDEQSRAGS